MNIANLTRDDLKRWIRKWTEAGTLDPRVGSKATAKGHKHRVGLSARPSEGKSSHAIRRDRMRANKKIVREVLNKAGPK